MFKEAFKYYKAKWPIPNFDEVIDLEQVTTDAVQEINLFETAASHELSLPHGLRPLHSWQCYELPQHPGLLVIRNPFTAHGQRYWMARCLRDFPCHPNVVNLNSHLFTPAAIANWWRELQNCKDKDEARRLKISMRWTTLGYHHNWDTKIYSESMHSSFPRDLSEMCNYFAAVLGYESFAAQAAIINYYPIGTTLAGHTDHSEQNLEAPLFSFSFGQTAIFLIGGKSKEERPTALYLKNGDVLVMSKESRLCYHAVPRVMKATDEIWNDVIPIEQSGTHESNPCKKLRRDYDSFENTEQNLNTMLYRQVTDEVFWLPFKNYLNDSRINMNVRQVLNSGDTHLS